jgi:hypothetical protein
MGYSNRNSPPPMIITSPIMIKVFLPKRSAIQLDRGKAMMAPSENPALIRPMSLLSLGLTPKSEKLVNINFQISVNMLSFAPYLGTLYLLAFKQFTQSSFHML